MGFNLLSQKFSMVEETYRSNTLMSDTCEASWFKKTFLLNAGIGGYLI